MNDMGGARLRMRLGPRLKLLFTGLALIALFFLSLFGLVPIGELPVYSYLRDALKLTLLGLGVAITIYSAVGDRGCWIASIFFGVLTMVLYMFGGFIGPWAMLFLISAVLTASCIAVYLPKKRVLRITAIPLLFIVVTAIVLYGTTAVLYLRVNPFDDPRRDELNSRLGYSLCGEYTIDPIPGKRYVIEWNKTLKGDEELSCYIKIRVSDPQKLAYIHFKHQTLFKPEARGLTPKGYYAFTWDILSLTDLNNYRQLLEVGGKYFKRLSYRPSYSSTVISRSEDYTYINRWDFYIAYMPAEPVPANFGEYASIQIELKVEIDVIHPV